MTIKHVPSAGTMFPGVSQQPTQSTSAGRAQVQGASKQGALSPRFNALDLGPTPKEGWNPEKRVSFKQAAREIEGYQKTIGTSQEANAKLRLTQLPKETFKTGIVSHLDGKTRQDLAVALGPFARVLEGSVEGKDLEKIEKDRSLEVRKARANFLMDNKNADLESALKDAGLAHLPVLRLRNGRFPISAGRTDHLPTSAAPVRSSAVPAAPASIRHTEAETLLAMHGITMKVDSPVAQEAAYYLLTDKKVPSEVALKMVGRETPFKGINPAAILLADEKKPGLFD